MTFLEKLNWPTILTILVAIELQIGSGTMSIAHSVPDTWIPYIQQWSANLATIGLIILGQNSFGTKRVPGNSIAVPSHAVDTPDQANAKKGDIVSIGGQATRVVGALLFAFVLAGMPSPSSAQTPLPKASPVSMKFLDVIRQWISKDIDGAIALATAIPDLQDPNGAKCWQTFKGLGDVVDKHPLPLTLKLASDIESARLINMALKKVCIEPACAQVWLDIQNQVAALAPIGAPFTLNSICSKVL